MKYAVIALTFWWWIPPDRPDINHAFDAFVCNYQNTMCRDRITITDIKRYRRLAP